MPNDQRPSVDEPDEATDAIISDVVDACGKVRRVLGVGLLESVYREALVVELGRRGRRVESDVRVHVDYEGVRLQGYYSIDHLVDGVVVEAKATSTLHPSAFAQTLAYIRVTNSLVGLLVNFHAVPLRTGIHRLIVRRDAS